MREHIEAFIEMGLSPVADFLERHDSKVTRAEDILCPPVVAGFVIMMVMIVLPGSARFSTAYQEVRPDIERSAYLDSIATDRLRHIQRRFVFSHHGAEMPECIVVNMLMLPRGALFNLMSSKPHREALLDTNYTHFGVADGWFTGISGKPILFPLVNIGRFYVVVLGNDGNYDNKDGDFDD
jgi:hypothetical protein